MFTFALTELLHTPVFDSAGVLAGRVREVALCPQEDPAHLQALVVRTRSGEDRLLGLGHVESINGAVKARSKASEWPSLSGTEGLLLLTRDLLDQQIIDVHGRKVVRVNDVNLQEDLSNHHVALKLAAVDVGARGAVRRLLRGLVPGSALRALLRKIPEKMIPWEFVDLIETDPARRVKLKISHDRLAKLHPADIADIIEELAPAEREAVFETLDEEVAAEALEEIHPKLQRSIVESLDSDRAADIVEEMDPDAAADLLGDLSEEHSQEILEEMEPEQREEVSELLEFAENTAAGRMTTEYMALSANARVSDAIEMLRQFEGGIESVSTIFLLDEEKKLVGAVPLSKVVLASADTPLVSLKTEPLISLPAGASEKEVAETFDKYNLLTLPVLDAAGQAHRRHHRRRCHLSPAQQGEVSSQLSAISYQLSAFSQAPKLTAVILSEASPRRRVEGPRVPSQRSHRRSAFQSGCFAVRPSRSYTCPAMSHISFLECSKCSERLSADEPRTICPRDGGSLYVRYDLAAIKKSFTRESLLSKPASMWRYAGVLPDAPPVTLGEGFTPMLPSRTTPNVFIKDEGINPTGSFKARGMSAAVTMARAYGLGKLAVPSAGNAASALAAYAAAAGIEAHIFMPQDVPQANLIECRSYGAQVTLVEGLIGDCARLIAERRRQEGWFDVSTLKEPFRVEGKKTMGYEIAEQLGWTIPDAVIYPTGGGVGMIGMWKAFDEMQQLGWIGSKRPKMISVQSAGCAPIVKAWEEHKPVSEAWKDAATLAAGLRVPKAYADYIVLDILKQSAGAAVAVSDDEIMHAFQTWAREEGIFAAPEGAASLAAYRRLRASGFLKESDTVVLYNTGSGLKYINVIAASLKVGARSPNVGARLPSNAAQSNNDPAKPARRAIGGIIQPY